MASIEQLPEDLRPAARRIPADTLATMNQAEALLRASYIADLTARAAGESEDKARRTHALAEKIAKSLSHESYVYHANKLNSEMANLRGDSQAAGSAYQALRQLQRDNPPVPVERIMAHASAAISQEIDRLTIPPATRSRIFSRNQKRK
jgi:hypothetical protein